MKHLSINESVILTPAWGEVKTGKMLIFFTELQDGKPHGRRNYVCELQSGDVFLGTNSVETGWLAVATDETIIDDEPNINNLKVQQWLSKISATLPDRFFDNKSTLGIIDLGNGANWQPHSSELVWIEVLQGNLLALDQESIEVTSFPLTSKMWLKSTTNSKIRVKEIDESCNTIASVEVVQLWIMKYIAQQRISRTVEVQSKIYQRLQQDQSATEQVLQEFSSTLNEDSVQPYIAEGTDLLIAMQVVGRALGVEIKPPRESDREDGQLEGITRASDLRYRRISLDEEWWKQDGGPLLAVYDDRPVALIPGRNNYRLYSPQSRSFISVTATIARNLSPQVVTFYRSLPSHIPSVWEVIQFALRGRRSDLILVLLTGVSATCLNMLTPIFTGQLVNQVIPNAQINLLIQMGAILFGSALGVGLFQLTQSYTILRIEISSDVPTQAAVWDRLLKLPASFFREYTVGDLQQRVTGITEIRRQLSGTVLTTILTSMFALLNLGLMLFYSLQLGILALGITVVASVVSGLFGYLSLQQNRELLKLEGKISGLVVQLLNGVSKLRISGSESRAFNHWGKIYRQRVLSKLQLQQLGDWLDSFNQTLNPVSYILIFFLAAFLLKEAQTRGTTPLSVGNFMTFNTAFGTFLSSGINLSNTLVKALGVVTLWQRVNVIIKTLPEVDDQKLDPGNLLGRISMSHVSFSYQKGDKLILNNVSLNADPGEFIALVGESGSGKSTILRLLLGFETPDAGVIYYDRQELSKLNLPALRRQIGVVLQNGRLLAGSIFENIAGGALISQDDAWEAIKMAGLEQDISAMPMKLYTVVSEGGSNLSGGQRQRLLIARALARKPRLIFFDEATSALDNKTQQIVSESLAKLNTTRIVIAHRLSTIRQADRIYVLSKGQIVQQGSFTELLENKQGLFAQLMSRQIV